jgi:glutathione S-transferase
MRELTQLWPMKRFPLLKDGDRTVLEASCIIEYLDLFHRGATRLVPEDPREALEVRMLDRFFDNYMSTPQQKVVFDSLRRRKPIAMTTASPKRARCSDRIHLARPWMAGRTWASGRALHPCRLRRRAVPVLRRLDAAIPERLANVLHTAHACSRDPRSRAQSMRPGPTAAYFPLGAPDRD